MSEICPEMELGAQEQALLQAEDAKVTRWLEAVQASRSEGVAPLLLWAMTIARNYYCWKSIKEKWLTRDDAEDLAMEFLLEFERALPKMRSAVGFTRDVLGKKLARFIGLKKKRHHHEQPGDVGRSEPLPAEEMVIPEEKWNDVQWKQYRLTLQVLADQDEITRAAIAYRFGDPPLTYEQIAEKLDKKAGAVRMRVSRFYYAVRQRWTGG